MPRCLFTWAPGNSSGSKLRYHRLTYAALEVGARLGLSVMKARRFFVPAAYVLQYSRKIVRSRHLKVEGYVPFEAS